MPRQCWLLIPYLPYVIGSLNQFFWLIFFLGIVCRTNSKPGPWKCRHGYQIAAWASECITAPEPSVGAGRSQDKRPRDAKRCKHYSGHAYPSSKWWVVTPSSCLEGKDTHTSGVCSLAASTRIRPVFRRWVTVNFVINFFTHASDHMPDQDKQQVHC